MKKNSILRLLKFTVPHLKIMIVAAVCVLLVNTAQLAKPYILKIVIDDFLINSKAESGLYSITAMGIFYMLAIVLGVLLTFGQVNLMNYAGQQIISKLRKQVFTHIQYLPLSYLDKFSTGRLIT
ncbi:MAG: transporter ATP-binding protein, partial [Clostridia bacterium]|nr:transporter ATP-binding protein [Clostridia bacterium]